MARLASREWPWLKRVHRPHIEPVRIATWNVNSIRARKERVVERLSRQQRPDIVCLQETKVTDDVVPRSEFEDLGYFVTVCG